MILRSVMKHVRDQNWFAVGLDFLIVVVGVFIGIQVANWNEEQSERREEVLIVERLAVEVESLLEIQREQLAENEARAQLVISINPLLFGQEPPQPLSDAQCMGVVASHVIRPPTDELPILDELQESGRFDRIRDPELKSRLRNYILLRQRGRGHYREVTNEMFRLHSRYAEAIRIERAPLEGDSPARWTSLSGEGYRWQARCDLAALKASPQFLNEFVDNASRRVTHMRFYEDRIAALNAIADVLRARSEQPSVREVER
ncbi:MAG: hypothetical protein V2J20_08860 [Wenzhouxiangella sp.]|jgi:hypothetical protein|nr:hypothetical protein [Wenzhouxiangella sp.]